MSMQGKGPFTLTQWAELEQQALIYKYITANVPVPSSLLISIQKSFYPYGSLPPSSCKLSKNINPIICFQDFFANFKMFSNVILVEKSYQTLVNEITNVLQLDGEHSI